jgi:UPF0716 family protein affecting phage T7 exclusion
MLPCDRCQALILDHLYGLLEGPESQAVETHLHECATCATLRDEAARMQGLIARAARGAFPGVRFEPPAAAAAARATPATRSAAAPLTLASPAPASSAGDAPRFSAPVPAASPGANRRGQRISSVLAWVVAAAVLLAIPGTVLPVLNILERAEQARKTTEEALAREQTAVASANQDVMDVNRRRSEAALELATARQGVEKLLARWADEEKTLAQNQTARKMSIDVYKPATIQPGAPNDFYLVIRDRGASPSARLLAEVRDQTDAVLYSQALDYERKGESHSLRLPASVWTRLQPQSELFLVLSTEDDKTKVKSELQDKIRLFGPVYATMLATDRPAYHPGDMVYFRSVTLDRVTFLPPPHEQVLHYELRGPHRNLIRSATTQGGTDLVRVHESKVEPVLGPDGKPIRGVGCGAFALPVDLPDGDYTLSLRELPHPAGYPPVIALPVSRTFKVRSGQVEAYAKLTGYEAESYSAGEKVTAWAELKFQDKPVAGVPVKAVVAADDHQLAGVAVDPVTGPDGRARIRFTLPAHLDRADVRMKVTFRTVAGEESVADRVPVIGSNVIVEFFPEGGDLVAGVPCRVYLRATTPTGQPVDLRGVITDGRKTLARIEAAADPDEPGVNRGLRAFTYTPTLGTPVWLKVESPARVWAPPLDGSASLAVAGGPMLLAARSGYLLPKVKPQGVVMTALDPVSSPGEPIRIQLRSVGQARKLVVGAYTRGRLWASERLTAEPGQVAEVRLNAPSDPRGGVVRVTVFEEHEDAGQDLTPLCERLVYRKPGEALNLAFSTSGSYLGIGAGYAPNSPVELNVTAKDEHGKPTAAILWVAAVNSGVAAGRKDRLLTTHFLLAGEVNTPDDMEDADFLLTNHPRAAEALDLVLATQGWRRFFEQDTRRFGQQAVASRGAQEKLAECNGQYTTMAEPQVARKQRELKDKYGPWYEQALEALSAAQASYTAAAVDRSAEERANARAMAAEQAQEEARKAAAQAAAANAPIERLRNSARYAIAGFALLAVMLGIISLARPVGRLPFGIGTVGSVGLVVFLVSALGMADRAVAGFGHAGDTAKLAAIQPLEAPPVESFFTRKAPDDVKEAGLAMGGPPLTHPRAGAIANQQPENFGGGRSGAATMKGSMNGAMTKGTIAAPAAPAAGPTAGQPALPGVAGAEQGPAAPAGLAFPAASAVPPSPAPGGLGNSMGRFVGPGSAPGVSVAKSEALGGGRGWMPRDGKIIPDADLANLADHERLKRLDRNSDMLGRNNSLRLQQDEVRQLAKDYAEEKARGVRARLNAFAKKPGAARDNVEAEGLPGANDASAAKKRAEHKLTEQQYRRSTTPIVTPLVLREYAPARPGDSDTGDLAPDTILWLPVVVLPSDGKARIPLHLGTARGGYQVLVAGHTLDGRIGAVRGLVQVAPWQAVPVAPTKPAVPATPGTLVLPRMP